MFGLSIHFDTQSEAYLIEKEKKEIEKERYRDQKIIFLFLKIGITIFLT